MPLLAFSRRKLLLACALEDLVRSDRRVYLTVVFHEGLLSILEDVRLDG
jgi:hypothetical protein